MTTAFVAATLAAAPGGAGAAGATQPAGEDYVVTMGAVDPALGPEAVADPEAPTEASRTDRFEFLAFYPDELRIHRGDTVRFRRDGFHTVEFARSEDEVHRFLRRDELVGVTATQSSVPSDPSCVGADDKPSAPIAQPCVISGTNPTFQSGWRSARLTFDLPPGTYQYFCQIHDGMAGTIQIVDDDEDIPTPAEIEADRVETVHADTIDGAAVIEAGQTPKVEVVGENRVWTVKVGDFTADGRVAVLRFLPSSLTIEPDDEVVFEVPDSPSGHEIHTASFPADAYPLGFLTYLHPTCDPDELDGGAPNVPLQWQALIVGCPAPATLEFQVQPWAWQLPARAPGDVVATPVTVHDSGFMVPPGTPCRSACDPWTGQRRPSSSRAGFPGAGTFAYVCNVHPEWGMTGSVTVEG
ncbi:MAG: hypothetical protein KY469_04425 [Actinobacteria bacterium]|nr:hypothetical protein [Actinomycetota bacterium]